MRSASNCLDSHPGGRTDAMRMAGTADLSVRMAAGESWRNGYPLACSSPFKPWHRPRLDDA